jgi:hypothetical protein
MSFSHLRPLPDVGQPAQSKGSCDQCGGASSCPGQQQQLTTPLRFLVQMPAAEVDNGIWYLSGRRFPDHGSGAPTTALGVGCPEGGRPPLLAVATCELRDRDEEIPHFIASTGERPTSNPLAKSERPDKRRPHYQTNRRRTLPKQEEHAPPFSATSGLGEEDRKSPRPPFDRTTQHWVHTFRLGSPSCRASRQATRRKAKLAACRNFSHATGRFSDLSRAASARLAGSEKTLAKLCSRITVGSRLRRSSAFAMSAS